MSFIDKISKTLPFDYENAVYDGNFVNKDGKAFAVLLVPFKEKEVNENANKEKKQK